MRHLITGSFVYPESLLLEADETLSSIVSVERKPFGPLEKNPYCKLRREPPPTTSSTE